MLERGWFIILDICIRPSIELPEWVNSAVLTVGRSLPVFPHKQTLSGPACMFERCQRRTSPALTESSHWGRVLSLASIPSCLQKVQGFQHRIVDEPIIRLAVLFELLHAHAINPDRF